MCVCEGGFASLCMSRRGYYFVEHYTFSLINNIDSILMRLLNDMNILLKIILTIIMIKIPI